MRRQEFIVGLGAAAWPTALRVQQSAVPVVGFLNGGSADMSADRGRAFRNVANAGNRYHPQLS